RAAANQTFPSGPVVTVYGSRFGVGNCVVTPASESRKMALRSGAAAHRLPSGVKVIPSSPKFSNGTGGAGRSTNLNVPSAATLPSAVASGIVNHTAPSAPAASSEFGVETG